MVLEQEKLDISEMRESLGVIMSSFTYIFEPYAIIKEIDIIMSFEAAMLDVQGRWTNQTWGLEGIEVSLPPRRNTGDWFMSSNTNIPVKPDTKVLKRKVKNYKELFDVLRWWWESAVDSWNSQTGNWKDSIIICSRLRSDLMRIALKEGLVALSSSMYSIQMRGAPAAAEEFFDSSGGPQSPHMGGSHHP
jgi:hypothetical protein